MIGIICGSNIIHTDFFYKLTHRVVKTPYGEVEVFSNNKVCCVMRHSPFSNIPPHMINHKANITALNQMGVDYIISINSVGSLKEGIEPGEILIPDDFMCLANSPTFFDNSMKFIAPKISDEIRKLIVDNLDYLNINYFLAGTYYQTAGPRFETKAEIKFMKDYADVVGMTMASEVILASELDIPYASICVVDNYVGDFDDFKDKQTKNIDTVKKILMRLVE